MRASDKAKMIAKITNKVQKRGIPINMRPGGNAEAAEWVGNLLEELLEVDEPLGVINGKEYNHCPACNGIIGQSAFYCKYCGAYVRLNPNLEQRSNK